MSRISENTAFQCGNCGANVMPLTNGSYRNHCPFCLFSKHLDNQPGDRLSNCQGLMRPISLDYSGKKGYQIIHECIKCGKLQRNKVAYNTIQEDNILSLMTSYSLM
ncbi:RNHCP domain-containing protein [Ornithinibacillus bavariensis]|uniref:RNHCP domain-containing protein n=1 Tax=Ornithinibacillus bavariensis TaxID=545502 RepID=A0A919XAG0_9BACI|nr:RNHCP domain-containing protein [Ornithinibacillus bavariensis]GIO27352.1 hypothetical protein J43TS3_19630 [Ornithinibacillus bavariensis]